MHIGALAYFFDEVSSKLVLLAEMPMPATQKLNDNSPSRDGTPQKRGELGD